MLSAEVEAPVKARRPLVPSAMIEDEADAYPLGRPALEGVVVDPPVEVTVMTPLERVARAVLSERRGQNREKVSHLPSRIAMSRSKLTSDAQSRSSSTSLSTISRAGRRTVAGGEGEGSSVGERVSTVAGEEKKGREGRESQLREVARV